MKPTRCLALLLASALLARADLLPPSQDTSSTGGKLTLANGKASTLAVSALRSSYVYFDLNNLPPDVLPADIAQARLRIYFPSALKPGDLNLHTVSLAPGVALWSESNPAAVAEPPVDGFPIATILKAAVVAKKFVEIDVTPTVRAWRTTQASNRGFAFKATGTTSVTLGAKEGPGSGYPCVLEVEIDRETFVGSSGQIADLSVTAAKLADGSVLLSKLATSSLTVATGSGLTGGGPVSLGGTLTLGLGANLTLGGTTNGTFTGDGSGLTNLNVATAVADGSVLNAKLANSSFTLTAGAGLSGGGVVALGGATTLSLGGDLTLSGTTTFSGPVVLPAGTGAVAPLRLQAGVNLTPLLVGAVEFDGTNLFLTNNGAGLPMPTRKTIAFTDSTITAAQIATNSVGTAQLAPGLTLNGNTTGSFLGPLSGNVTGNLTGDVTGNVSGSAASFTAPLVGDVTGTQSATSVAMVGGATAAKVASATNLANAATDASTAGALVKRDVNGNFSTGIITLAGGLILPLTSSAGDGVILQNGSTLLHTFGNSNVFVGQYAGNLTMSGLGNTASGAFTLSANTAGNYNTASGYNALSLNTTANYNMASGSNALQSNTTGSRNTASGAFTLSANTAGNYNTASGYNALSLNTTGVLNTASGSSALVSNTTGSTNTASSANALVTNTTGSNNTASGFSALYSNDSGVNNTAMGSTALYYSTGSNNIGIGYSAGYDLITGNNNINLGGGNGLATEGETIRIGVAGLQRNTIIAGIRDNIYAISNPLPVYVDPDGKLGTQTSSRRFKQEIADMSTASEAILGLRPVTFRYKADATGALQFGLIAEEVNELSPALIVHDGKGDIYGVRYEAVNAMLLNEFLKDHRRLQETEARLATEAKAKDAEIAGLQDRLGALEKQNAAREARLTRLEQLAGGVGGE